MIKILLLLVFLSFGQTRVSYIQQGVTLQSSEGDWCPVKVFTRTSDQTLIITREASQSNPCYLHLSNQIIYQWTQNATVTITGTGSFDDIVFFYLTDPVLHISARNPERFSCQGCVIDPKRTGEFFPPSSLIVGFYNVSAGVWAVSGNAIINQHQIVNSQPITITYLPNQGYTFTLDNQSPAVQSARQTIQQMMPAANEALSKIQQAHALAVQDVKKAAIAAGVYPTDVNVAAVQEKLASLKTQAEQITQQQQQIRMNSMQSQHQMYRPEVVDPRMMMINAFPDMLFKHRIAGQVIVGSSCGSGSWTSDATSVSFCLDQKWSKFQLVRSE